MHRVQQVGLGKIGHGATEQVPEDNVVGVNPVRSERSHVMCGISRGIPMVVTGGVVIIGRPVIAHLVGGALTPDARAVEQVVKVAVLRIIGQPHRNSGIASATLAISAQGGENTTLRVA
jgi:hypothetical protein